MTEASLLDRLTPGDHVCLIFDDEPLRTRSVAAYIRAGLRDHHRILYHGPGGDRVEAELTAQGVDVGTAYARGQLRIGGEHLSGATFDPEATIESWRAAARQAAAAGYRGLRAVGDMSWARIQDDRLTWYESRVNRIFAEGFAMGVCLYNRRLFSADRLRWVTRSHPATVTEETDPRAVPLFRAVRISDPPGIRLEGEADLSNRHALNAVIEHLLEDGAATLTVDVGGLRFADSAAARNLLRVADGRQLRLVGCSRSLRRLLTFHSAGQAVEYVA
ncbi:MEDS domain-containing protein [Actinoplanes sp. NPDC024001]|uniref:MEDS domain-containing protein n=1 Tax=Actinoplanes sp. NPDC024001 TaxID=3154598 RepID=UPI0034058920